MHHPMVAQLGSSPQLGFSFDSLVDKVIQDLKQAGQSGIDSAKAQAISQGTLTLLKDPTVQESLRKTGEENTAQMLANKLLQVYRDTGSYVVENPYKSALIVGGVALAAGLLLYMVVRR